MVSELQFGDKKKMALNDQQKFVALASDLIERMALGAGGGKQFGSLRDLDTVFGYKKLLTTADYLEKYERDPIAGRIVDAFPAATWQEAPAVEEADKPKAKPGQEAKKTAFEMALESITERIPLYEYMQRADVLAQLGRYSILVLGVNDTVDLALPLVKASGPEALLWLKPYGEESAKIEEWNKDTAAKEFGMPLMYEVTMGDPADPAKTVKQKVHASRCIHIAEGLLENDVFGRPRLKRSMDRLYDLAKIVGGDAETFFKNARGMINAKAATDAPLTQASKDAMKEQIDELEHLLRNIVLTQGVDMVPVQLAIANPREHVDVILDLIAGGEGFPKRILIGSEQGVLAGNQDESAWGSQIKQRRAKFAKPRLLHATFDRLQLVGILPVAKYNAGWPEASTLGETQKAAVNLQKAQTLQAYSNTANAEDYVTREEFRETFLGMTPVPEGGFADPTKEKDETPPADGADFGQ